MPVGGIVVGMNTRSRAASRIGRAAIAALFFGLATASPAFAATAPTAVVAAPAPGSISARVTDEVGVLSPSDKSQLEEKIKQLQTDKGELLYILFVGDTGTNSTTYAENIVSARGDNTAAYVVDVAARQTGAAAGTRFSSASAGDLDNAAQSYLANDDWAGAANAVVDTATSGAAGSGSGAGWLVGGAGAVAVAGGGIWAATRRKSKAQATQTLEVAREIAPSDTQSLDRLPVETLDALAREELVSADESIRRGKEELKIAISEFGPERTRAFTKAMNHSTTTLQRAFSLRQRLDDAIPESPAERRSMLVEIISSCGQADDALDQQAQEFAKMRDLLINAPQKLDELTQRTVDLRARLPHAQETLQTLTSHYPAEVLSSIADNAEMAEVSLNEAEKSVSSGRELAAAPAGQQGGLVAAIRDGEHAIEIADRLLSGIENAETNIAAAKANLASLITEIEEEISEAQQLEAQGKSQGTKADWDSLEELLARAHTAVESARAEGTQDPLGSYSSLMAIDTELDDRLDRVREKTSSHARQIALFKQQISVAESNIQAADDLISSRGRIIGSGARTALADAKHLHAEALHLERSDIRAAQDSARRSVNAAQTALKRAKDDIDNYRRRQMQQRGASTAGNIVTGMVLGQILGGGGHGGGFGGGFGGGGFGGGGGGFGGSSQGSAF